jgi:signal recognition particle receptor subunit beta
VAVLDVESNAVVIRIVYDGPPEAGKTTSLRALSASLARPMTTPAEADERTLYFDWLEYTGGLFEGHQIRCQIVTVPGQTVLAHRRHALLEAADVVVFVSDSNPQSVETTRAYMTQMREILDAAPGPPVGVIVQANKRDLADAVDLATLRAAVPERGVAVLESVATKGQGVREAFVFAVRLALDRVRELLRDRALMLGTPAVQNSNELLRQLERRESESLAQAVLQEVVAADVLASETSESETVFESPEQAWPHPPDHNVPSGMIWPPVEGRVLLLDACGEPFVPRQLPHGDWIGEAGQWRFHSPKQASYGDPELGRRALIEWARVHASGQRWFSAPRVVALAATGDGAWRLWQIVKNEESLRDRVVLGIGDGSPRSLLRRLLDAGRMLLAATESLPLAPCRLPITVDTVGAPNGVPVYIGFLPDPFLARASYAISAEHRPTLLRRELGALAAAELRGFDSTAFPRLRAVVRETDHAAVIDALHDVLLDAGLADASRVV